MEGKVEGSPKQGFSIDNHDKYVSGLSTILVATIQEAKDRISQIEYIFCSQIFPSFQSKTTSLQRIYSEAKKYADDEWKEKENDLLLQIERLQREKRQAIEQSKSLKLEKEIPSKEQEEKIDQLQLKIRDKQLKIEELTHGLLQKSSEVDEAVRLQQKLLQTVTSKASLIEKKERQMKENEEKTKALCTKLSSLEKKVNELEGELKEKLEDVVKGKEMEEKLVKKIDLQASGILRINYQRKDSQIQEFKLKDLEANVIELQKQLYKKTGDFEEVMKLKNRLIQQNDLNVSEMLRNKEKVEEHEKEKKLLVTKINSLEEKGNELWLKLSERNDEVAELRDSCEKLYQQIESKASDLLREKKRKKDVIDSYKSLKSQYIFLCRKFGLTIDQNKTDDVTHSAGDNQNMRSLPEVKEEAADSSIPASYVKKEMDICNNSNDGKAVKFLQASTSHDLDTSPNNQIAPAYAPSAKPAPVSGTKRPASSWRETRSHQTQLGPDPHDDFLDTPFENIRENLIKVHELPIKSPKDEDLNSSFDETQPAKADNLQQRQQFPAPVAANKGFKYVEPVRKKAERENLRGIECKECKKFYDAVLLKDGKTVADEYGRSFRCEHHEGVSRHRYRYVPPMTPEGFWNIGFESEM